MDEANQLVDGATLFVWDADERPPVGNWIVVLWRSVQDAARGSISIPKLVERHSDVLRMGYLAWIYELGERKVRGRSLVDHLQLRPGLSYWWMSLLAEKCSYSKSPHIADAIRLMAFTQWVGSHCPAKVVLVSANRALVKCIRSWCVGRGLAFEWKKISGKSEKLPLARWTYQLLPNPLRALIWLTRHLRQSWQLRGVGLSEWKATKGRITFVSYLFNLPPDAVKAGRFESSYWAHLPKRLQLEKVSTNWLHWYVKDSLLPGEQDAANAVRQFNAAADGSQTHATLNTFLSTGIVVRTLRDAGSLAWKASCIPSEFFQAGPGEVNLWPLFEDEWRESSLGVAAMNSCLSLNLFESALQMLPKQKTGVYLQENQGWEFAFIHAWRLAGHGRLIGAPHSTIRYWDLRYFFDQRSYDRSGSAALPLPDQVALNGHAAMESYRWGNYPMDGAVEVEALRYLHLESLYTTGRDEHRVENDQLRILVLGDYVDRNTHLQMSLLEAAISLLPQSASVTVKPHPACPILPARYPGMQMEVTNLPIAQLLTQCSVAYTSAGTSAAADVYCAGLPVVSVFDADTLNQSPLRGRGDVSFVSTAHELASALISAVEASRPELVAQRFFNLDSSLPRWCGLLISPEK